MSQSILASRDTNKCSLGGVFPAKLKTFWCVAIDLYSIGLPSPHCLFDLTSETLHGLGHHSMVPGTSCKGEFIPFEPHRAFSFGISSDASNARFLSAPSSLKRALLGKVKQTLHTMLHPMLGRQCGGAV